MAMIASHSTISIDAAENYQKKSFRNRYEILTCNGRCTLSIPLVKGKAQQCVIKEVKIAYDMDWVKNHLYAIKSSYGRAPFFEEYFPRLEAIFTKKYHFLFDLNMHCLAMIVKAYHLDLKIDQDGIFCMLDPYDAFEYDLKSYNQVFEHKYGFVSNLSSLDLLMNLGPEARGYIAPF